MFSFKCICLAHCEDLCLLKWRFEAAIAVLHWSMACLLTRCYPLYRADGSPLEGSKYFGDKIRAVWGKAKRKLVIFGGLFQIRGDWHHHFKLMHSPYLPIHTKRTNKHVFFFWKIMMFGWCLKEQCSMNKSVLLLKSLYGNSTSTASAWTVGEFKANSNAFVSNALRAYPISGYIAGELEANDLV